MTATAIETGLSVTIAREVLREGLRAVAAAIPKRSTLEVLSSYRLVAERDHVAITATDLDHWATRYVPAEVKEEGVALLPAESGLRLVDTLPPQPIHLSPARGKGYRLALKCGGVRSTFSCLAPDEFPSRDANVGDAVSTGTLPLSQILLLAQRTSFAVSNAESRPILQGVKIELRPDCLRMVATNGSSLALAESPMTGVAEVRDVIVDPRTLDHVARCLAAEAEVEVAISDRAIVFRGSTGEVVARLIEGPFPTYKQIIPSEARTAVVIEREPFLAAVKRMVFASGDYSKTVYNAIDDRLEISSEDPDRGDVADSVPCRILGPSIRFGANARFVSDVLAHLPTSDVRMELTTPERAIVFRPEGSTEPGQQLSLIMPLRLH